MLDEKLLTEASEFLCVSVEELERHYQEAGKKHSGFSKCKYVTEEEWKNKNINPQDEREVAIFYQETRNHILELIEYHSPIARKELTQKAIEIIKENRCGKVVDYGAGIGQDSIMYALTGLEVIAVDLPGLTFGFAKWRFQKRGLDIKTIDVIPGEMPLRERYDVILCFEVMQHLVNPEETLEHFHEHLNPEGLFLMTARFKGNYELALKANEKYEGRFRQVVESKGFSQEDKIHMWGPEDERGKYLEVYRA